MSGHNLLRLLAGPFLCLFSVWSFTNEDGLLDIAGDTSSGKVLLRLDRLPAAETKSPNAVPPGSPIGQ